MQNKADLCLPDTVVASVFSDEICSLLKVLRERTGLDLWMLTRVEGDDWIVLEASENNYEVNNRDVFRWSDSFCSRMVKGEGPQIAPESDLVPAYLEAEIGNKVNIKAYIGIPINRPDGTLFGTLCAIDPAPKPLSVGDDLSMLNVIGSLVGKLIECELKAYQTTRLVEQVYLDSMTDPLTGARNRRAWQEALANEEARTARLATPVAIIVFDLDEMKVTNDQFGHNAGDELLIKFVKLLVSCAPANCTIYRVGGDEFTMLLIDKGPGKVQEVLSKIQNAQEEAGIRASAGVAMRHPEHDLQETWELADAAMYDCKQRSRKDKAA